MYINVVKQMDFSDFEKECWSGAKSTLERIEEEGKEEELIDWLNICFYDSSDKIDDAPTLTTINDLLWFDGDYVLEQLDIDPVKKYDIDDLEGKSYFNALENYLNEYAPYDEEMEKLKNWLWENCGTSATNWTVGATKTIYSAIKENYIDFDADGNIIND